MRLVAVSIVKNEADIIEAFVRHTFVWVDYHLIFDHDSTDGTREILGQLQKEGLPLTLFSDDAPGHLQQFRSNHLSRLAAQDHGADWVVPLDGDEIFCGPDRSLLEKCLNDLDSGCSASLPLLDYLTTTDDDPSLVNSVERLRYSRPQPSSTRKILIPRPLALDGTVSAGKGNHALQRGAEILPDRPLPADFHLAHLAQRSPQHQFLRVVRAELQRQSRGRAATGLDLHYRLGYQLLAENPSLFFDTVNRTPSGLALRPIPYRGGPLKYTDTHGWERVVRGLLPYLEELATSHGKLADRLGYDIAAPTGTGFAIRELAANEQSLLAAKRKTTGSTFIGFTALDGWSPVEGPVAEAFLPPFHWGYAPATHLIVHSREAGEASLFAEILTYSDEQSIRAELNGQPLLQHNFSRINQKKSIHCPLRLIAGENQLVFHYSQCLVTSHDPRKLAVIFLALEISGVRLP
ncbi:MAG TPA: glycosyltransferase family 2 protein [Lacunisphaera sp.]|jgi:hypothetical protein